MATLTEEQLFELAMSLAADGVPTNEILDIFTIIHEGQRISDTGSDFRIVSEFFPTKKKQQRKSRPFTAAGGQKRIRRRKRKN